MTREPYKDAEIMGHTYRLSKFDALTGSNILRRFMAAEKDDPRAFLGTLDSTAFEEVQRACLRCASRIEMVGETPAPMPVMMADGRLAFSDLAQDSMLVYLLTMMVLGFNVAAFFDEDALKEYEKVASLFASSNAST